MLCWLGCDLPEMLRCWQSLGIGTALAASRRGRGVLLSGTLLCRGSFGLGAKSSSRETRTREAVQTGAATLWPHEEEEQKEKERERERLQCSDGV